MLFRNRLLQFGAVLMVTVLSVVFTGTTQAQVVELVLDVGDTSALPGEQVIIPVYLSNYFDTIAGFNFWVQLDRPDIMEFTMVLGEVVDTTWWQCLLWDGDVCLDSIHVSGDTTFWQCHNWVGDTCTDSTMVPPESTWDFFHLAEWDFMHIDTNQIMIGTIDSTGTLVAGWEYVNALSLGSGYDLNVVGLADLPPPPVTPGIPPQEGGVLIKLVADVYDIPDTMTERTVNIHVETNMLDHFGFSDPWGNSIGLSCGWVPDTSFWLCTQWAGEVCLNWQRVYGPPYDSTSIDSSWVCVLDTNAVQVLDGSVTVLVPPPPLYGDVNCNGSVDIADLVYVVDYMFCGGPPSPCERNFDCDDDGEITITDLICLVEWMFPPW
jgi:hypothetical protein